MWHLPRLSNGRDGGRRHPPIRAAGRWSGFLALRIPGCSGEWLLPFWRKPYSGHTRMSKSRAAITWWQGVWTGASEWPPPLCQRVFWLIWQTGESGTTDTNRIQDTCVYFPFPPQIISFLVSYVGKKTHQCSPLSYQGCNPYPITKGLVSVGCPSIPSLSPSPLVCWVGLT